MKNKKFIFLSNLYNHLFNLRKRLRNLEREKINRPDDRYEIPEQNYTKKDIEKLNAEIKTHREYAYVNGYDYGKRESIIMNLKQEIHDYEEIIKNYLDLDYEK